MATATLRPTLERRLASAVAGEVLSDLPARGRYATDASHYQMWPAAVVVPKTTDDIVATLGIARQEDVPVTLRGGGTSQCGQAINTGIIVDTSKHLRSVLKIDVEAGTATVEAGIVLDDLNRALKPHGVWFPVDISTSSRATIGGMAGNNACGGRSLRYGTMRDNVRRIDGLMADGTAMSFRPVDHRLLHDNASRADADLFRDMIAVGAEEAEEIAARFPSVQRRVGGYNLDALTPSCAPQNMAHLLVGSEGTLAVSTAITLKLAPLLGRTAMGVCHFGSFAAAMDAAQHLVALEPIAVELIDRTMIALGRDIPIYARTLDQVVRGDPAALLVVEFAGDEAENRRRVGGLADILGDLGIGWQNRGPKWGGVVPLMEPAVQSALTEVRKGGLNIMMSMKEAGKPVSFVEDCAVPLEHLGEYTEALTAIFEKHGTRGTWYAHASVGCLHVRPILNLKQESGATAMRAIAEEAFELVRKFKGSHSGEHGDGLVRSEFHEAMYGNRLVSAFERVKDRFDPGGLLNPGKIVRPPKMDDRSLFRYGPDYAAAGHEPVLDWSVWPGNSPAESFLGAVEMCNNNGACRKAMGGVMCPSFRATGDEVHVTRGRANTLRLALSGQLGPDAITSDAMADAMQMCVACKACRRECPTGIDMARMKIEMQAARAAAHGIGVRERLFAHLPAVAPYLSRARGIVGLRDRLPGVAALTRSLLGIAPGRSLPTFARKPFAAANRASVQDGLPVALFVDTFSTWLEPEIPQDAIRVLEACGFEVTVAQAAGESDRRLCCGRTYLAAGLVERARDEASRTIAALEPLAEAGMPILGLEPSCLFTLKDELPALVPGSAANRIADAAQMAETFLAGAFPRELSAALFGKIGTTAFVHGHCHQKAFGEDRATVDALRLVPDLKVTAIESSCCGMAGAFGYQDETFEISQAMGEISLFPAIRAAAGSALMVANGTSCRHQIRDGTGRTAIHLMSALARSIEAGNPETGASVQE